MSSKLDAQFAPGKPWHEASVELRAVLLGCNLEEEMKWGKPCYRFGGHNIAIIQKMKGFVALLFFKGALLKDPKGLLEPPGPNSNIGRRICFTDSKEVVKHKATLKAYVREAVAVAEAGLSMPKAAPPKWVEELHTRLDEDAALRAAFSALTPGRQREYHLHFSSAKQSATRKSRIDKCVPAILAGKGLRDR